MTKIDTSKKNRIVFTKIQSMEKSNFVSEVSNYTCLVFDVLDSFVL
jgi:hypothetical protein